MQYLTSYGAVWRLTNSAYVRFVKDVAEAKTEDNQWDLNDYGTQIIGNLINVTDFDQQAARTQDCYNRAKGRK